jgi:hypothetical protein
MLSYPASAAWSYPVSSPCYTEHGQCCGAVLSGRITTVAMSRSGQQGLHCTVEPNYSGLSARLAGASVTRDYALDTCEPSCVPRAARPFFIPVVHNPLRAVGYVTAPEPSSRGGRVRSHGTRSSAGAHLAMGHVAASELNLVRRRDLGPCDTWQHRSSPQQGGEVHDRGTRDGSGALLCREVWSEATTCMAARGYTSCSLS